MRAYQLLAESELGGVRDYLSEAVFRDGRLTAHGQSQTVKVNDELDSTSPISQEMTAYLATRIMSHPNTHWVVFPRTLTRPIISRTRANGGYGRHIDASQMQDIHGGQMRTDISYTLFLSDPDSYDGGELSVCTESGQYIDFKLPAGDIVFYNAGRLHEVKPVTRGERLVCIGWIESMIHDEQVRNALWSLTEMQTALGEQAGKSSDVFQSYALALNALRRSLLGRV